MKIFTRMMNGINIRIHFEWGSIDSPELPFNRPPKEKDAPNYHVPKAELSIFFVSYLFSEVQYIPATNTT